MKEKTNERKWFYRIVLMLILLQAGLLGCTAQIQLASNLAQTGVQYADAMDTLLGSTSDLVVLDDSKMLLYQYDLVSYPDDKKKEEEVLNQFLTTRDANIKPLLAILSDLQTRMRTLKAYFTNMAALADTDASQRLSTAVENLSTAIDGANTEIRETLGETGQEEIISAAEQTALGQLAGLVGQGIQAEMLREALKRDAPIIGEQLYLTQKLLDRISGMVEQRYTDANIVKNKNEVVKPYKYKTITDRDAWMENRKTVLTDPSLDEPLQKAQAAAGNMLVIWEGILKGSECDMNSIQLVLADIQDFIGIASELKASEETGGES